MQGNVKSARDLFRMGIKANPGYGALWQAYGVLEFQEQNVDQARSLFEEGLRRDPTHVMLYQVRGNGATSPCPGCRAPVRVRGLGQLSLACKVLYDYKPQIDGPLCVWWW